MKSRMVPGLIAAVAAMAFVAEGRAETPSTPKPDRGAIEKIVRDYLVEHPEIIEEALKALRAKWEIEQRQSDRDAIAANGDALRAHPMTPVSGNPAGDVTIVEFFDYQCGYCKRSLKPVMELLETDSKVRIVWKEYPILGPVSRFAARAAMAAGRQGRYYDFHVGVYEQARTIDRSRCDRRCSETRVEHRATSPGHEGTGHREISARNSAVGQYTRHPGDTCIRDRRHAGSGRHRRRPDEGNCRGDTVRRLKLASSYISLYRSWKDVR